jgi:hypothetical protein
MYFELSSPSFDQEMPFIINWRSNVAETPVSYRNLVHFHHTENTSKKIYCNLFHCWLVNNRFLSVHSCILVGYIHLQLPLFLLIPLVIKTFHLWLSITNCCSANCRKLTVFIFYLFCTFPPTFHLSYQCIVMLYTFESKPLINEYFV